MITEDYVSFEIAKLLKEKGFNPLECGVYYSTTTGKRTTELLTSLMACPTHQRACKWLREVHNIFISIIFCTYPAEKRVTWTPEISTFDSVFPESAIEYDSYEEAVEAAIKYCLENLI